MSLSKCYSEIENAWWAPIWAQANQTQFWESSSISTTLTPSIPEYPIIPSTTSDIKSWFTLVQLLQLPRDGYYCWHEMGYAPHAIITRRAQKNRNDHSRTGPHATQVTSSRKIHQLSWRAPLGPRIVCNYATNVTI